MDDIMLEISELLQKGRAPLVKEKVQQALENGCSPKDILEQGLSLIHILPQLPAN